MSRCAPARFVWCFCCSLTTTVPSDMILYVERCGDGHADRSLSPSCRQSQATKLLRCRSSRDPPVLRRILVSSCLIAGVSLNLIKRFCSSIRTISLTGASRMSRLVSSRRLVNEGLLKKCSSPHGGRSKLRHCKYEGGENARRLSPGQQPTYLQYQVQCNTAVL